MTRVRRVYVGARDGVMGVYVSKPGYDAKTASAGNMQLMVSERYSNLLKVGLVDGTSSVALGYGAAPFVLLTSLAQASTYSTPVGVVRPSPLFGSGDPALDQSAYAVIASDGSTMTITSPIRTFYAIYSRVFSS